jgi:hypothetical protein
LLLPKCPLCWIAIAGLGIEGSSTKFGVETIGIAAFSMGVWKLLQLRRMPALSTLLITMLMAALLAAGAWMVPSLAARLFLWGVLLAGIVLIPKRCCSATR